MTAPQPPRGVVLHLPDGRAVPIPVSYDGFRDDMYVWLGVVDEMLVPGQALHFTIEELPPNTTLVFHGRCWP